MNKVEKGAPTTLEPVAWHDHPDMVGGIRWSECELTYINKRLSDAAAIIAAKEAEIEQHRNNIAEFIRDADKKEETLRARNAAQTVRILELEEKLKYSSMAARGEARRGDELYEATKRLRSARQSTERK